MWYTAYKNIMHNDEFKVGFFPYFLGFQFYNMADEIL